MKKLKQMMMLLMAAFFFLTGCQRSSQNKEMNEENQRLVGKWELYLINKGLVEEKTDGTMTFDENGKMFRTRQQATSGTKAHYLVKENRLYFADSKKGLQQQIKQEGPLYYELNWQNDTQVELWHADHDFGFLLKKADKEDDAS